MNRSIKLGIALASLLFVPGSATQPQAPTPASQALPRKETGVAETILEVLEQSQKSGKGVLVYLGNHAIGGAVTKLTEHTVELKNREYGRIVLRLDRIDGVASN